MKNSNEVNLPDPERGWTPLYKAVLYRDLKLVRLLLKNGADPNLFSTVIYNIKKRRKIRWRRGMKDRRRRKFFFPH